MNLRKEKTTNNHKKLLINQEPLLIYPTEKDYPEIMSVECQKEQITATLSDGRVVGVPTVWFKRLRSATSQQLKKCEILPDGYGITWPELDEDISVKIFVEGLK